MAFIIPDKAEQNEPAQRSARSEWKLCPCGTAFEPYRPYQRFCSEKCRNLFWRTRSYYNKKSVETRACKECGELFESSDAKRRYCTHECYAAAQAKRHAPKEKRRCPVCGAEFESSHWLKRYCSEICRTEARRKK